MKLVHGISDHDMKMLTKAVGDKESNVVIYGYEVSVVSEAYSAIRLRVNLGTGRDIIWDMVLSAPAAHQIGTELIQAVQEHLENNVDSEE